MEVAIRRWVLCIALSVMTNLSFAYDGDYADKPFTPSKPFTPDHSHHQGGWGQPDNSHNGWPGNHDGDGWYNSGQERYDRDNTFPDSRHKPHRNRSRSKHDRHYHDYFAKQRNPHRHRAHENYYYHTYYMAPIKHHYHRHGYRLHALPVGFFAIQVNGYQYYYFDGIFYINDGNDFLVVHAPIGAAVPFLPPGFISFPDGLSTYYYVNGTYYRWDDVLSSYVVIEKPDDADNVIKAETAGRLYAYPNKGQSEELQSKDRYECHQWAVSETGIDPGSEQQGAINNQNRKNYKRAISACLLARGYTVQ